MNKLLYIILIVALSAHAYSPDKTDLRPVTVELGGIIESHHPNQSYYGVSLGHLISPDYQNVYLIPIPVNGNEGKDRLTLNLPLLSPERDDIPPLTRSITVTGRADAPPMLTTPPFVCDYRPQSPPPVYHPENILLHDIVTEVALVGQYKGNLYYKYAGELKSPSNGVLNINKTCAIFSVGNVHITFTGPIPYALQSTRIHLPRTTLATDGGYLSISVGDIGVELPR